MTIAIPSYNRPLVKTLYLLKDFDPKDIIIYVNNYKEEELGDAITEYKYEVDRISKEIGWDTRPYVFGINAHGIPAARNQILEDFVSNAEIVMMDDDIENINELKFNPENLKGKLEPTKNLKELFENAFRICEKNKTKLWGFYPVNNSFYMSNKINPKGFVIGTCFGVIKSDIRFDENLKLKEDYDFTIQHLVKFKKVVRFDNISIEAGHYNNPGGCVEQRKDNSELEKECCDYILDKWPDVLVRNPKRDNEVLINL